MELSLCHLPSFEVRWTLFACLYLVPAFNPRRIDGVPQGQDQQALAMYVSKYLAINLGIVVFDVGRSSAIYTSAG